MRIAPLTMLSAALLMSSCVASGDPQPEPVPEGEHGYSSADAASCATKNGSYQRRGMMGQYSCAVPYADAGKTCSAASDCEGQCRVADSSTKPVKGQCQATTDPFGCYEYFSESGEVVGICVD